MKTQSSETSSTAQLAAANAILPILIGETDHHQVVLAGYAGTGKTWLTGYIVGRLHEAGYSVAAITHANKALGVLRDSLPTPTEHGAAITCMTMFRALGWRPNTITGGRVQAGNHRLSGYDVLVVDEASMVDGEMYERLQAISGAREDNPLRILWVGDPAQLPPVSDSNELSPVFTAIPHQERLTEIVRQAKDSPIIRGSMYVRGCLERAERPDLERLRDIAGGDVVSLVQGGVSSVAEWTISAIEHGMDCAAVAWTNKSVQTVAGIVNRHFHPPGSERLIAGDLVTFGRGFYPIAFTDEQARVVEVGERVRHGPLQIECLPVTLSIRGEQREVMTPVDQTDAHAQMAKLRKNRNHAKRNAKLAEDQGAHDEASKWREKMHEHGTALKECEDTYADLRPRYALTAHKAQGSTYDAVVIDWQDMQKNSDVQMLCRLLYVAVTRPSKYLVICF